MTSGSCVVCQLRDPRYGQVCESCRTRLASWLLEVPRLVEDVLELGFVERDTRRGTRAVWDGDRIVRVAAAADPVANVWPAGPLQGASSGPHVSGAPGSRPPLELDAVDLTLKAGGSVVDAHHDQLGHLPVAAVLAGWADDWAAHRGKGEARPLPVVGLLCSWLGNRLEEACDDHPAIADFAAELAGVRNALYGVLGLFDVPDYKRGVPCRNPRCDALNLVQRSGSRYVECLSCPQLLTEAEFVEWTQTLAGGLRALGRKAS